MADKTAIEWTDATWNPIRARNIKTGKVGWHCEHATTGCEFCYAEGFNKRLGTGLDFKPGHRKDIEIFLDEKMLTQPLRWKKPRKIFVCSMTDLFAEFVSEEWIDRMFAVMMMTPRHTYQILTKRADRMHAHLVNQSTFLNHNRIRDFSFTQRVQSLCADFVRLGKFQPNGFGPLYKQDWDRAKPQLRPTPLPNVWLGVSAERQEEASERIPLLLQTPAYARFISAEPLLGEIKLKSLWHAERKQWFNALDGAAENCGGRRWIGRLDWIIAGGESGPRARPMNADWVRSLRDQCAAAGANFFFKQWGEYLPVGQSLPGFGKVHGATAVKPGRMKLHYGGTPKQAPKHAFAERGVAVASTADGRLTFRVGKKAAGRLLDGVEHNGFPEVAR